MRSIIIEGPQGCGKTLNAEAIRKHFGMKECIDADEVRIKPIPTEDCLILSNGISKVPPGLQIIKFKDVIKLIPKHEIHPLTPSF